MKNHSKFNKKGKNKGIGRKKLKQILREKKNLGTWVKREKEAGIGKEKPQK